MEHEQGPSEVAATPQKLGDIAARMRIAAQPLGEAVLSASDSLAQEVAETRPGEVTGQVRRVQVGALSEIAVAASIAANAKAVLDERVASARDEGLSWANIGRAVGITPQVAQRRWDTTAKSKHAAYQRSLRQGGTKASGF